MRQLLRTHHLLQDQQKWKQRTIEDGGYSSTPEHRLPLLGTNRKNQPNFLARSRQISIDLSLREVSWRCMSSAEVLNGYGPEERNKVIIIILCAKQAIPAISSTLLTLGKSSASQIYGFFSFWGYIFCHQNRRPICACCCFFASPLLLWKQRNFRNPKSICGEVLA